MVDVITDNNNDGTPCHNSPRYLAHLARMQRNIRQSEMKTDLLQIMYVNPFAGLDHENTYTDLIKFYEISGTLKAPEEDEEATFLRLFPHSIINKLNE